MRDIIAAGIGVVGGVVTTLLGGWDLALQTLVCFIMIDYATGFLLAGVFKKSKKNASGALNSRIGFKGIVKKCMMLLLVLMGYRLDYIIGWDFLRYAIIIALIANESISILENAGLMGVPIPHVLKQAIEVLRKKGDGHDGKRNDAGDSVVGD